MWGKMGCGADLQVCCSLDIGELVGQAAHARAVLQQLVQHKVQQGGLAVCALHICQLQESVQLEPCTSSISIGGQYQSLQLVQHKRQQGHFAVCPLYICQLQQSVQLEPCSSSIRRATKD